MLIEGRGKKAAGSQLCDPNTEQGKECEKKIGSPCMLFPAFSFHNSTTRYRRYLSLYQNQGGFQEKGVCSTHTVIRRLEQNVYAHIGECRRVELARALINSPPILILDEITANLDDDNIWDIFHLLTEINHRGTTVIMATHASKYVNIMRRRVVTLVDGRLFGDVRKGRYGDVV